MSDPRPFDYPAGGRVRTGSFYAQDAPPGGDEPAAVLLVVHGLFARRAMPEIDRICRLLARSFDVVSVDLRGHGDAPGWFTWGVREHRELTELVSFLHGLYPRVGVLGFSIGGSIAILSAGLAVGSAQAGRPDALCTVGAPAHMELWRFRFGVRGFWPHLRMVLFRRRRMVRLGWPRLRWRRAEDLVDKVSPVPLLLVHGDRDWLVRPHHARRLYESARPPRSLLMIEGGLHAEFLVAQDAERLAEPVRRFFSETLRAPAEGRPGVEAEVRLRPDRS